MTLNKHRTRTRTRVVTVLSALAVFIVGLGASPALLAQETAQDTLRLDWDTAWKMALEKNETLRLAKSEVEKARYRVKEAYSSAMPTVDFNGTFNHYFEIPSNPVTMPGELNFANPGQPFTVNFKFGQENNVNANIQLTQPVWLAGKVGLALKVAKDYARLSRLGVEISREDLRVMLVQSFYGAMLADEYTTVARDAMRQAEKYRDQVNEMYQQGVVSEYDLIRAKVAVSNLRPQVSEAEAQRDLALKGLKNMLGTDVDRPIVIDGDLDMAMTAPEEPYETASNMAQDNRLELQQLELQKRLYGYQYKIESRSAYWPNLLVGLRWETTAQSPDMNFGKYNFLNGYGGQVILQIPLFDGFASHNRAQQAKVNMKKTELQMQQLKRGIKVQVYQALRNYQKSTEELDAALQNVNEAEKGYDIAQTRYSGGVGTQLEVLDAQLQLNRSRVNLLQAKYNLLVNKAQYDRAVGKGFTLDTDE